MADQSYDTKLESLRRYIPFLVNMMAELKTKGNRDTQLKKIQSLHDMITDTRKRLKLETLNRCEEVLTNIYDKVNPQFRSKGPLVSRTFPGLDVPKKLSTLPGIEGPQSTPASPSPPRDIFLTKPVNIPMEKVSTPSSGLGSLSTSKSHLPKINVYSNVMIHPPKSTTPAEAAKGPDMSKPPISLDDLKTLEDDVQQKISDAKFANASVDDLQAFRKELELQLRVDSVTSTMSPEKTNTEPINTTVRNNPTLSKRLSFSESKSKTQESQRSPKNSSSNIKEIKTATIDKKHSQDKEGTSLSQGSKDSTPNKSPQKLIKDSSSIFGSLLSSIDDKILGSSKKNERRSSVNLNKDDSGSNSSLNKSDTKGTEAKSKQTDKSKESKDKKSSEHKHRRSSVDKEKHKSKDKSKEKSSHKKKGDEKVKKDKKKSKKEKHKSKERKDEDKSSKSSPKSDNKSEEIGKDEDAKKKDNPVLLSDILLFKSKLYTNKNTNLPAKEGSPCSNKPDCNKNTDSFTTASDAPKDNKSGTSNAASTVAVEKTQSVIAPDVSKTTTVYRRLADKYNPKPRSKTTEDEIPDVDKAVSDSIENFMKVFPPKPVLTSLSERKSAEMTIEPATSQSSTSGFVMEHPRPIQLPEILQKIFSKPLLGDIIPKRLTENMFPLTAAAQNKPHNTVVNPLTKPGAIQPPEPPILSPPRRPLSFQPPDVSRNFSNFMSPPQRQEFMPGHNALLPTPVIQHGILPSPPIPPNLPRGFSDHNPMMEMGFGTPRVDFDGPSTPMPDFSSPRVDFEAPVHLRNEFMLNQRFVSPVQQEHPMHCFDPRNQNFMAQPQFQPQPEVNVFNNQLVPGMGFYGSNQMPMVNPEVPHYRSEQNFYQERAWHESGRWGRDRRPGDPRNYKEHRERLEREAKAAQEKQKEIKDPRLVPRDMKDGVGEKDVVVRDPRLAKDSVDKSVVDKSEVMMRDPRLSRGKDKSIDQERELDRSIELDKNRDFRDKSRDYQAKSIDKEPRERARSRERALSRLRDGADSKDSRSRPRERESRFDKMYSRTNRAQSPSQSRSRDDKTDEEESFVSPLDSLYNAGEKGKTGRGYGVQKFKIPRKLKKDDNKRKEKRTEERRSGSVGRKKRYIEITDSSDESDANDVDNNSVPDNDSDVESLEELKSEKRKDVKNKSIDYNVETVTDIKTSGKKIKTSDLDTSRIKVIIKSGTEDKNKSELNTWNSDSRSLDTTDKDLDFSNFVSEYDKEFQLLKNDKSGTENVSGKVQEYIQSSNDAENTRGKKYNTQLKETYMQVEEPSSSHDVEETADRASKLSDGPIEARSSPTKKEQQRNPDDTVKKSVESVEADSSKRSDDASISQESTAKSDEPSEQNILAHFFENLLKSKNKKDKKTALFSLIETFSDSFDTREIQKIRKIIKANEDEEESDDEDKSKDKDKADGIKDIPMNNTHIVDVPVQEEQPVVGSTTEEVPTENNTKSEVIEVVNNKELSDVSETQVNEVTKSSEDPEQPTFEETKSEESLDQSNTSELLETLEPVMVSVGERIKNRRRNLATPKPRRKGKSELDMLHEDIQDMFIRDGVVTATGKRMCRILKCDPTALSVTNPEDALEQPKKMRKKPGPKPKPKLNADEVQTSMKDMRIVIKKMPDNVISATNTRQLRNRNRLSSYAESDDEIEKNSNDMMTPHKLRSRGTQGSYIENDDDSEKSDNDTDTALPEDNESVKSEIEAESTESEDEEKKFQMSDDISRPRIIRRRRGAKWASGIIPKNKKKKPVSKSEENSPYTSRASSPEVNVTSVAEDDFDKLVEPDKDYYYDYANKKKMVCKLCSYSGLLLTGHYLKEHPQSEVLCSRLAPHVAAEAIKDFSSNGKKYESIINKKMSTKYHYCCRVCGFTSMTSPIFFYEHVTTHTGEYRHQCGICEYFAVTGKTMAGHFLSAHPDQEKKAIRRTYTLAIVFGYICGECNFLQLKEKSVEDHANIFHLGEKPNIYKINMSTILDPIFANLDLPRDEPKALEPKLTNVTVLSTEVSSENATESESKDASFPAPKKRRKPGPKPKIAVKEAVVEDEKQENETSAPVVRKKPGPRSKTIPLETTEQNTPIENVTDTSPATSNEQVIEKPSATPTRKKPGPKSKTRKSKPLSAEEKSTVDEPDQQPQAEKANELFSESATVENVDELNKEAPIRKRRRSLDKLISEDSGDDLDTIITLSSRSSRAAKEKATAKLKTLMESNEGLSPRKKADADVTRKENDKDKSEKTQPNESANEKVDDGRVENVLNKDLRGEQDKQKEASGENQVEEMLKAVKENLSDKKDLNVFTCKVDILEEEGKKIEEERLRKMEELNKSIGSRTSKLDFVDKLSDRLNNEQSNEQPNIRIKREPKDDYLDLITAASRAGTPTMPVLEKEVSLQVPITRTPPLTRISKSPVISKKPVLDDNHPLPQSSINFLQNKSNCLFSSTIEKLQGKVNEAAEQQQRPSTNSPSLLEETSNNAQPLTAPEVIISIGDLIALTKRNNEIIYSCHANNCYVATKDKMVFQLHCKFGHKDLNITSSLCDKCGVVVEITPDTSLLENLYDHLVFAHLDCLSKTSNLRMRRLSGDKLSVKQELSEKSSANPSQSKDSQDFEAGLDCHVLTYVPTESAVHTLTEHVPTGTESSPTTVPQEPVPDPMEIAPSLEDTAPNALPADAETSHEEPVATEATLELSEDNPFSFKIANVVSLATSGPENSNSLSAQNQNIQKQKELPLLKPVPPLTLIGIAKQQPSAPQNHLVVKEAKLTFAELSRPKKAPKALQKFVDTPGDLYKCPQFYCMYSTNVRTFLERHLRAHKCDSEVMMQCVYCDMKTPWEHVPMHIDIRHASCRFACSFCLYRASLKEYVYLHQEQAHPDKDFVVLSLPTHKAAKKFSVADAKIDCKSLCEPYRCVCKGEDGKPIVKEYLFETEFTNHLKNVHQNKFVCCGYPGCTHRVSSSLILNHWSMFHGVCTYQCGYCKTSSKEITRIYTHFSQLHPSSQPDILVRVNEHLPTDRELGYSKEAFEKLGHIKKIPQNLITAISKRNQRSVKMIQFSGSPEESSTTALSESTSTASTAGGSEKVYLVPAAMMSPNKGQSVTSVASISRVVAQTSSASNTVVSRASESILTLEQNKDLPKTSIAAISSSGLPQVPVKIGDIAIHPLGKITESSTTATATTSSSHSTIAALSRSLLTAASTSSSLISQRPFMARAGNKNSPTRASICKIISSTVPLLSPAKATSVITPAESSSEVSDNRSDKPTTNVDNFMESTNEDTTSQDSSTGLSEDDILQSAIQSILDADDLSESGSNLTPLSNAFTNEKLLDDSADENASESNQAGIFVDIGIISSNDPRPSTPDATSVRNTGPPPLVLISNGPKSDKVITVEKRTPTPSSVNTVVSQETNESTPEQVAPVEHVELVEDIPDSSLVSEDVDPLNMDTLESNDDSNLDTPLFDDINVGLDSPLEDPLTITPTINFDLPSTSDPLNIDDLPAATDPLDVGEDHGDDSGSQSLNESSPGPVPVHGIRRSMSMVSNSDEESDSSSSEKGKKRGLMGYQLYRCSSCNLSFSNVQSFKTHIAGNARCKKPGGRQFQCVHCEKTMKTPQRLVDHIQTHGIPRFSCSLCNEKFSTVGIAKLHMKNRHNIQQTNLIPLKSDRTNMDVDEFMVKPGQANQSGFKDKEAASESPKHSIDESTFNPDQIDSIPIRQIFSNNVKCGKCNYQTKVRVNIVRHLQMHLEEKAVPDTAPVNPVPCLEKNEKMFDKMINLAASSITTATSRMGGASQAEKEEDTHPEYIPSHRRYVCSAHGCSYLCPEEGNLKHHLAALHSDDSQFLCGHCKQKIEPADPENVIKHLKLHGLHLYKCHYCSFVHHLKHKVEKHITDGHLDAAVKVVTVRCMESEPQEFGNTEEVATPQPAATTKFKPWRCCMCKVKCHTKEDIQSHIVHRHDIDTQYKCTLCTFKNDNEYSFKNHFKEKHPSHEIDVIFIYQKVEEEAPKEDTSVTPFDTTPLWQRDKPRVRHIRGILFDEVAPQPTKSPKKPTKTYAGPSASKASFNSGAHSTSSTSTSAGRNLSTTSSTASKSPCIPTSANKNLFDCIDAVARGTAAAVEGRTSVSLSDSIDAVARGTAGTCESKNNSIASSKKDPASVSSKDNSTGAKDKVAAGGKKEETKDGSSIPTEDKHNADVDSGNDDVIEVKQTPSIIVIDSDDSDTETTQVSKTDDTPTSIDKGSVTNPVSTTRGMKRQSTTDLLQEAVKLAKIEEPDDEDSIMVTNCSKEHLISIYGLFGSPHNKQWKCPKCHQFKSKRVGDFMFHIYKDFNVYRYKCKACSDLSITYKYMLDHITLHPGFTEDIIEPLTRNVKLETWIHMVIREQSLAILKNSPLLKKRPVTGPTDITCYFCNEKFMSMPDCYEHMLYHWVMMPYQCQHCPNEFYTVFDLKHHHKIEHPDLKLYVDPKGPTLSKALQSIENVKKRPLTKSAQPSPSKKKAKVDDTKDAKEPKVEVAGVTSGIVVNTPKLKKGQKGASASSITPSTSTADVIRIDDDDDDLVVVSKIDDKVPNDDEVFACDACAYIAETETVIIKHLFDSHGVKSSKFHSLSKKQAEIPSIQDMACNICEQVFSELKLRRHFLANHLESHVFSPFRFKCDICSKRYLTFPKVKMHFTRCHAGLPMKYKSVIPEIPNKNNASVLSKSRLYSCTMCSYTNVGPNVAAMRAHLKGHLRPIVCNHCKVRFKYYNEVQVHNNKDHPDLQLDFVTLEEVQKEFTETIKDIAKRSVFVTECVAPETPKTIPVKNIAKKSTSAPFMSPKAHSDEGEEYTYYGIPAEDLDLKSVKTTFELDGLEYTTTAEQMMKMFNMNTFVDVSDCAVDILPLDKS